METPERTEEPKERESPVSSHNEWDPLEEVLVGWLDGAAAQTSVIPRDETRKELENLAKLLKAEGVTVRRPDAAPHARTFETVDWKERGFSSACPRDSVLVMGEEILETPLGSRARYYETDAFRTLFLEYFRAGARWTSAPRPELKDDLYEEPSGAWLENAAPPIVINEAEPILSAGDVLRCGRDVLTMQTAGTNQAGITWLRRHLGDDYQVRELTPRQQVAGSLDTLLAPLGENEILLRDDAIDPTTLPEALLGRTIRAAPPPSEGGDPAAAMNILMLDPKRALVEASQTSMLEALRTWGYDPIPVALGGYAALGGSIRRATVDIRRAPAGNDA